METGRHSLSSLPIVSRLDHLDFIIKSIERQQNPKWRDEMVAARGRQDGLPFLPVDTAVREAYFKGSLLERVAALENRLFQLCLELESSSTSSTSTGGSGESSSQRTKRDFLRTLPTFNNINPNPVPKQHPENHHVLVNNNDKHEIQEMTHKAQERKQEEKVEKTKQQNEKKQTGKNANRNCKAKKKKSPYKWTHFKLLGC